MARREAIHKCCRPRCSPDYLAEIRGVNSQRWIAIGAFNGQSLMVSPRLTRSKAWETSEFSAGRRIRESHRCNGLACRLFLGAAFGQFDSGQIAGVVHDPTQSVIAGANETLTNEGNGEKRRVVTNSTCYYVA